MGPDTVAIRFGQSLKLYMFFSENVCCGLEPRFEGYDRVPARWFRGIVDIVDARLSRYCVYEDLGVIVGHAAGTRDVRRGAVEQQV